jgi:transposase
MTSKQRREFTPEFKREAVGLLASRGRTIREIAGDLDLGLSALNRWKLEQRDAAPVTIPNPDMTKELARLRKENEILLQERDLLKKATAFFVKETSR